MNGRVQRQVSSLRVAALFAGCGGLDLGFSQNGFDVVWANEYDGSIAPTYRRNFPDTEFDGRSITDIASSDIPDVDGMIGGPPCQSWSLAGAMRGMSDPRGGLFLEYIRVLRDKRPSFFVAENVKGMLSSSHRRAFAEIVERFKEIGYSIEWRLLNASSYGVPQDRERVFIVGVRTDVATTFSFPEPTHASARELAAPTLSLSQLLPFTSLRAAIGDLPEPSPALEGNRTHGLTLEVPNHEYMTGGFSPRYLSRNRRRGWDEPSFTIQAGGRHAPLHPSSPEMRKVGVDEFDFATRSRDTVRRLSVRECARIQTFPDDFVFIYDNVSQGYKMIGNAVPVRLASAIAEEVRKTLARGVRGVAGEQRSLETSAI